MDYNMIGVYTINGYSKDALKICYLMNHLGTNHENITFVYILLACNHASVVDDGYKYFHSLSAYYCITTMMNNYACIV